MYLFGFFLSALWQLPVCSLALFTNYLLGCRFSVASDSFHSFSSLSQLIYTAFEQVRRLMHIHQPADLFFSFISCTFAVFVFQQFVPILVAVFFVLKIEDIARFVRAALATQPPKLWNQINRLYTHLLASSYLSPRPVKQSKTAQNVLLALDSPSQWVTSTT